jgi:enoyl-CoA hydratase
MGQILASRTGGVMTLTLHNPRKSNALDLAMLGQLSEHIDEAEADTSLRLVVLRGPGGGPFSSGADIGEWGPMSPQAFAADWIAYGNAVFDRFEALRCPTLAAIEGLCFGGGLELALCADLRIAAGGARLRFPEATIGAMPGWHGGPRLAQHVGRGRALEAVLTGAELDAARAADWGLLNAVAAPGEFEALLAQWQQRLVAVSPCAAAWSKAAVLSHQPPADFYAAAALAIKSSPDADIGIQAFARKTKAVFPLDNGDTA